MEKKLEKCGDLLIDEELKKHTTLRVGGKAKYFIYPYDEMNLMRIIELCGEYNKPYKILGNGSNTLASDHDFDGVVIALDRYFNNYHFEDDGSCYAQAGVSLILLSSEAMRNSLTGLEFASGIPGTLGGGVYMNAGAYKSDMSQIIKRVQVLCDNKIYYVDVNELGYSYRTSIFQKRKDIVILGAELKLTKGNAQEIKDLIDQRRKRRMDSQPLDKPSAGSMFRNPDTGNAWKYIDEAGLRGKKVGGAQVSEKHSNFIINADNASAQDIADLVDLVKKEVKDKFGIELRTEVERFNW